MTLPSGSSDKVLEIYLTLAQYPILRTRIRERMRRELFSRGVIAPKLFEVEIRENAIKSQAREGLYDPLVEETGEIWDTRVERIRSHFTDFYFAYNLSYDLFEQIIRDVISERVAQEEDILISFNPELASQEMLFEQGRAIEQLPEDEFASHKARLQEIKVVLIRRMISDQLAYINIAREWFTIIDLLEIQNRKIGYGKIGGKAAGMLLAARILNEEAEESIRDSLTIPESYFIGSDVMYDFMAINRLMHWNDQKYKSEDQIHSEYPQICDEYSKGIFPEDILEKLNSILKKYRSLPLIVRSSSLLEDNFGMAFAGKYESVFCPNQGSPEENIKSLTAAIAKVYASGLNPDALLYRRSGGLQNYDERLGILIQVVQGERYGKYFLPHVAGVGFSRNLYRWSPQIRKQDGFLRIVWGLGTRAVDRVGNDYPRLVALSHPFLRPEADPKDIRRYSQREVDLINLEKNLFETLPITEVIDSNYPMLRYLAQVYQAGYLKTLHTTLIDEQPSSFVFTFNELLRRTSFAEFMRKILNILEKNYNLPVDLEFTVEVKIKGRMEPKIDISILQCRPQSQSEESNVSIPDDIPKQDIIFSTRRMVPHGKVEQIEYVLFINPDGYYSLATPAERSKLSRMVGKLNSLLSEKIFICVGPGRWGTTNPDLGVKIGYGDIYNTRALVELAGQGIGPEPEPSFGTHFFQDLVEAKIFPLAIFLDDEDTIFNRKFFYETVNSLDEVFNVDESLKDCLILIKVDSYQPGRRLELVMDNEKGSAIAFLTPLVLDI